VSYTPNYLGGWQNLPTQTTRINATALNHIEQGIVDAAATADAATVRLVTPVAVKSSAYTAVPGDFVPVDVTGGGVTVTLPAAPADKTVLGVKLAAQAAGNTVTIARGGTTDTFNASGSTSLTLRLLNQGVTLQYQAAGGIWWVLADDLPLTPLDSRYAQLGSGGIAGQLAPKVVTLTDAATIALDASGGNDFRVTIAANRTMGAPSNLADGQSFTIAVTQDATGGRTMTWNAAFKFGAAGAPTLTTTANATDVLAFKVYGSAVRYLGSSLGF